MVMEWLPPIMQMLGSCLVVEVLLTVLAYSFSSATWFSAACRGSDLPFRRFKFQILLLYFAAERLKIILKIIQFWYSITKRFKYLQLDHTVPSDNNFISAVAFASGMELGRYRRHLKELEGANGISSLKALRNSSARHIRLNHC